VETAGQSENSVSIYEGMPSSGARAPSGPGPNTLRHTTLGRTPLEE